LLDDVTTISVYKQRFTLTSKRWLHYVTFVLYLWCEEVHRNLYLCASESSTLILLQLHGSLPQYKERNVVRILAGFGSTTVKPIAL